MPSIASPTVCLPRGGSTRDCSNLPKQRSVRFGYKIRVFLARKDHSSRLKLVNIFLPIMSSLSYRFVHFEEEIVKYEDLKVFRPTLITAPPGNWYYLGPIAVSPDCSNQRGLIVKANVPDALCEVVDWRPVFIDIEGAKFSTWRGVPSNPDYVVIGDFFVTGIEKPSPKQTEGIRAVRRNLIDEVEPHHLVFKKVIPFAVLTLWTVTFTIPLLISTGAFVSAPGDTADSKLGVIRFNAHVQELTE